MKFDVEFARSQFPGVSSSGDVLMDNAGGSQVASHCIRLISDMLSSTNVQLGASYTTSAITTDRYNSAFTASQVFVNAPDKSNIVIGSSTTQLMINLASAFLSGQYLKPGDEVIVTNVDHEANIGCWVRLANAAGAKVKFWRFRRNVDNDTVALTIEDLKPLLSNKTKLVCFTHCSNILGSIMPVREVAELVHSKVKSFRWCFQVLCVL
jgi:selenocysteine lyase/cysteine desulfurase